mmetsp:Transcript_16287/g.54799  ORF Transcript_16287/g.54799 Transcript_16287/m.54799 type:complete len:223 (-) Transcript_16287:179-847(-)
MSRFPGDPMNVSRHSKRRPGALATGTWRPRGDLTTLDLTVRSGAVKTGLPERRNRRKDAADRGSRVRQRPSPRNPRTAASSRRSASSSARAGGRYGSRSREAAPSPCSLRECTVGERPRPHAGRASAARVQRPTTRALTSRCVHVGRGARAASPPPDRARPRSGMPVSRPSGPRSCARAERGCSGIGCGGGTASWLLAMRSARSTLCFSAARSQMPSHQVKA